MKAALAALAILAYAAEQVEMTISIDGKEVGTARITERALPDGGKSSQTRMYLAAGEQEAVVVAEAEYAADGTPKRKYARRTGAGGSEMRVVTFANRVASLTIEIDGIRETKKVPAPEGADIRAVSELWHASAYPKSGTKVKYHRFDINKGEWEPFEITYKGKQDGCYYTESTAGKAWIGDDGLPVKIIAGKLTMVRKRK